jgi:hypothetical protein
MTNTSNIWRVVLSAVVAVVCMGSLLPVAGCSSMGQQQGDRLSLDRKYAEATVAVDLFRDRLIAAKPLIPRSKWADVRALDDAMHSALVGLGVAVELGQASRAETNLQALDAILADVERLLLEHSQ